MPYVAFDSVWALRFVKVCFRDYFHTIRLGCHLDAHEVSTWVRCCQDTSGFGYAVVMTLGFSPLCWISFVAGMLSQCQISLSSRSFAILFAHPVAFASQYFIAKHVGCTQMWSTHYGISVGLNTLCRSEAHRGQTDIYVSFVNGAISTEINV